MAEEDKTIALNIEARLKNAQSVRELRQAIREAQGAMLSFGKEGEEQSRRIAQAVANARDRLEEVNQTVNAFDPDNRFAGLQQAAQGIATGVQLATSAMALFGSESEDVQKIMMRVQAAMAFSQAISQIGQMKDAFAAFNAAVKANPILGVVAAIIALTTAAAALYEAFHEDSDAMKAANAEMERTKELSAQLVPEYKRQEELAQAQGKSLKEINQIRRKSIEVQILEAEASARASIQRIKEIRENDSIYESILRKAKAAAEAIGATEQAEKIENEINENKRERAEEDIKNVKEQINNLKDFRNQLKVLDAQEEKQAQDNYKKYTAEQDALKKKEMDMRRAYAAERVKLEQSLQAEVDKMWDEQSLANAENEYDRIERERKQAVADFEKRNKELKDTQAYYEGLRLLKMKYDALAKAEEDKQAEESRAQMEAILAEEEAANDAHLKQRLDKEIATEKAINDAKVSLRQSAFSILNSIADLELVNDKKNSRLKKAIALAEIGIDTAKALGSMTREAADAAAKAQAITPVPGAGAIFYVGYYAARLATIVKNIAAAKRILQGDGSGAVSADGGGGGAAPTIQTPTLFTPQVPPQQTALGGGNQSQQTTSTTQSNPPQLQPPVVRAYVVERDITNSQNTATQYEQLATFTG